MSRRVLITGGNRGIGFETVKLFHLCGDEIFVVARDFKKTDWGEMTGIHALEFDLDRVNDIRALTESIGPVDILINNAGIMNSLPYDDYPEERESRLMNVNLYAPIELIRCVAPAMLKNHYGRIVNVASIAGEIGHPDIWYGISKAGMINATKSFAKLLGGGGIVINAVAPSPVNTDMLEVIPPARREFMKSSVYLNRFAEAGEVAATIFWLATDCPEYINGSCIDINNGAFPR